jgi:hypothetical protein
VGLLRSQPDKAASRDERWKAMLDERKTVIAISPT